MFKRPKFKIIVLTCFISLAVFSPRPALADSFASDLNKQTEAFAGTQGAGFEKPADARAVVAQIIRIFLSLLGILFVVYGVYAGYTIMTSAGDRDKVNKGKSALRTAVIGVVVILAAYAITRFVIGAAWQATTQGSGYEPGAGAEGYYQ